MNGLSPNKAFDVHGKVHPKMNFIPQKIQGINKDMPNNANMFQPHQISNNNEHIMRYNDQMQQQQQQQYSEPQHSHQDIHTLIAQKMLLENKIAEMSNSQNQNQLLTNDDRNNLNRNYPSCPPVFGTVNSNMGWQAGSMHGTPVHQ